MTTLSLGPAPLPPLRSTFLAVNGVTLHVVGAGPVDGPLVVLLHGFPEFWYGWRGQIGALAEAGYHVMAPDGRGYNLSDKPREVAAYRMEALCADVLGLLNARGRERALIVGHDWGAAVAWSFALRHPQRVERLVILNVPHPAVFGEALRSSREQRRKSWYMFFFQLPLLPELLLKAGGCGLMKASLRASSRPGTFSEADLERYREAWSRPGAVKSMLNWYRAMFRFRGTRMKSAPVRPPTLILWGADDHFLGAEMAEASVRQCEDARLELLPGVSHWIQHEARERVNAELLAFLG